MLVTPDAQMSARTLLGFDYGKRRIGIAVGQEITRSAQGLATIEYKENEPDWSAIDRIVKEWRPALFIVGMPQHPDKRPHEMQPLIQSFADKLAHRYQLPVAWMDEQLSSHEAAQQISHSARPKQRKQDKAEIDKLAAELILQSWLNSNPG
jgi:putative Holliday junction resolvase